MANTDGIYNLTSPAVMNNPNLYEPRAFMKNNKPVGDPKFSINLILDPAHPDFNAMKAKAAAVAKARWPSRNVSDLKFPFAKGDALIEKYKAKLEGQGKQYTGKLDFMAGKIVLKASSKHPPALAGIENGKIVNYDDDTAKAAAKTRFFNGAEVLAQINFMAYEGQEKDGVTAYVNLVLTTGKGTRLSSGSRDASEVFKGYVGNHSDFDPTADEEIAF